MILDPDAERLLVMVREAGRPPLESLPPAEARAAYSASRAVTQPEPQEVASVTDMAAPGPHGNVPVRFYVPAGVAGDSAQPCLVYFHGGGWVLGDLDSHDVVCRHLANASGCRVLSVDYRMAPEYRFPASFDDSVAATRFAFENAARLGIDPARIAVGGDSAGGNLAAAVAIHAARGGLPKLAYQLLIYPVVDLGMTYPSYQRVTEGVLLTAATMRYFVDLYTPDPAQRSDWRGSPIRAADLSGTPPALVVTAAADPLCDEGIAYARRLEQEGVRVLHMHFSDQIHGFLTMGKVIAASGLLLDAMGAALRKALTAG
ncbi:MAG: alpha/beta hydrolase [Proteobacteria bacterium]|nr:alpha/beta hydrolase [Pseudomonadota bacterium]